jgi:hypothetical protein
MANTYKWKILQLDAKIKLNDLDNVIYNIHWRYVGEDNSDEQNPITIDIIGVFGVEYDPENFIPYEDLTKEDVVGWLEAGLDVEGMKTNLDEQIELQKNPVDEHLQPEWD